ncbi:uncharacterized protein LOC132639709 [Lycium barbarum]|uniref:uncharacterized protein LOC132639709 n=1 Tax=Lycium barbarum TaxID=112863 RepID=UPI00293E1E91|nr:uncharacterized protein LOC132639709 [Lycium barbarum]
MPNSGVSTGVRNTQGFEEFTIDSSHPFYIHPSDSPGSQLVAIPFNGTGFVHWRSSMVTSLSAKNKLGMITGKVAQPTEDSPLYPFWERCNDMVKAWITNFLTREIDISVMCLPTANEVWGDINDRFGQSNGSKYIQLQKEISFTSQGSFDISNYFTKLRSLWDELSSAYVGPTYTCWALHKFIENQHLFQFISGLNDSYSTVTSSLLLMSPLPSICKAYSLLHNSDQNYNQRVNSDPKKSSVAPGLFYDNFTGGASPRPLSVGPNDPQFPVYGLNREQFQQYNQLKALFHQANISPTFPAATSSTPDHAFTI